MGCCSVCGKNWITGLTSAASPGVDIWSTCKVGHTLGVSLSVDMLLSAVSVLVIVLQSLEFPEGLMNNPYLQN
jgi:uncharacterized membrane protein YhiD involved in acid resistance